MQAILGTRASADINLVAQLLMLAGLGIGFYFARTHQIPRHRNMQTAVVAANSFFILFVMFTSFYNFVILGGTTGGTVATLMIIHGILGLAAELTGIYLILRMSTQLIPPRFRVKNFRLVMRSLLGLWTIIVVLGLGIYYFRYLALPGVPPMAHLQASVDDLSIHAGELKDAAARGSLAGARRHAEHLINLIEGKSGPDYGDADKDGVVEDPGDGVGALNYLKQARDQTKPGDPNLTYADQLKGQIDKLLADAKAVIQAADLQSVSPQVAEIGALAGQFGQTLAGAENMSTTQNMVTVSLKDFVFNPKTLTIKKGTTVLFVNQDNAKHTVTADNGGFDSKDLGPGKTFSFTFNTAGTFPYHCEYHGDKGGVGMAGTIIVQ